MISNLNSNISFAGKVYLGGQNQEQKEKLAMTISNFTIQDQDKIIGGLNAIKKTLESQTPDDQIYEVNFMSGKVIDFKEQIKSTYYGLYDGLDVLLLTVTKDGKHTQRFIRTSDDVSPNKNEESKNFTERSKTKAIKQLFKNARVSLESYVKPWKNKPTQKENIASILKRLG